MTQRHIARRHTPTRHSRIFTYLLVLPKLCAFCRSFSRDPFPPLPWSRPHNQAPYPRTIVFPYPCSKSFVFLSPGPAHLPGLCARDPVETSIYPCIVFPSHVAIFLSLSPWTLIQRSSLRCKYTIVFVPRGCYYRRWFDWGLFLGALNGRHGKCNGHIHVRLGAFVYEAVSFRLPII
jgi:hypothetical protein